MINEKNSVFSVEDFVQRRNTTFVLRPTRWTVLLERLLDLLPDVTLSVHAERNYRVLRDLLLGQSRAPQVLVLGGSIPGQGMQSLVRDAPSIELISTDVSFGPLTALVCDAHDIPFDDATFDGVVAQAVLEHVVDAHRCVQEIHRVLKPGGLVYAETPFMQQVHMGRYDFARFTHSGHRRLFRHFSEIRSGPICRSGHGARLVLSVLSLELHQVESGARPAEGCRPLDVVFSQILRLLPHRQGRRLRCGRGVFSSSVARKTRSLSDRELIKYYKGAQVG